MFVNEAAEHAAFEKLVGGTQRAEHMLQIYIHQSWPSGTEYDKLFGRARTKEQNFAVIARNYGFPPVEIRVFLALQGF